MMPCKAGHHFCLFDLHRRGKRACNPPWRCEFNLLNSFLPLLPVLQPLLAPELCPFPLFLIFLMLLFHPILGHLMQEVHCTAMVGLVSTFGDCEWGECDRDIWEVFFTLILFASFFLTHGSLGCVFPENAVKGLPCGHQCVCPW